MSSIFDAMHSPTSMTDPQVPGPRTPILQIGETPIWTVRSRWMAGTVRVRAAYLDGEQRRAQILRVASTLFAERGYEAVSTADVADAAGVVRGLVNHYFGIKRQLFVEVVTSTLALLGDAYGEPPTDEADRERAMRAAVELWLHAAEANRSTWLACVGAQGFGRDAEVEAVMRRARERIVDQLIT